MKKIWLAMVLLLFCTELDAQMQKQIRVRRLDADTVEVHIGANNRLMFANRVAKIYFDSLTNKLMFVDPSIGPVALDELTTGAVGDTTFKWSVDGTSQIGDSIRFSPSASVIPSRTGYVLSLAVDTTMMLTRYGLQKEDWVVEGYWRFDSLIQLGHSGGYRAKLRLQSDENSNWLMLIGPIQASNESLYIPTIASQETLATNSYAREHGGGLDSALWPATDYQVSLLLPKAEFDDSLDANQVIAGVWMFNTKLTVGSQSQALADYSIAMGDSVIAGAASAVAFGYHTQALGIRSHAEGWGSIAEGVGAHAEGNQNYASGDAFGVVGSAGAAHAEGNITKAFGPSSHTEGEATRAGVGIDSGWGGNNDKDGLGAHAEGSQTWAVANAAHAEGEITQAGYWTHIGGRDTILGVASHAEGSLTKAFGDWAHAEGRDTYAGDTTNPANFAQHAEGYATRATGLGAHAEGRETKALGASSHAEGEATMVDSLNSTYGAHVGGYRSYTRAIAGFVHGREDSSYGYVDDVLLGRWLKTGTGFARFVLGKGVSADTPLVNTTDNSLFIGFNSNLPSLSVLPASGTGTYGQVVVGGTFTTDSLYATHYGNLPPSVTTLGALTDVDTTGKADGMVLEWSSAAGKWIPAADNTGGGGSGGGVLDTVKGGSGLSLVMNSDSVHTMSVNVKGAVSISNDTLIVDSTSFVATDTDVSLMLPKANFDDSLDTPQIIAEEWRFADTLWLGSGFGLRGVLRIYEDDYVTTLSVSQNNVDRLFMLPPSANSVDTLATRAWGRDTLTSDFMVHGDTASLSSRINAKYGPTDTVSTLATQYDINDFMAHGDTASLSSRINAKYGPSDTTATLATQYDLTLKSDAGHNHTLDGLSNVLTTGKSAGNVLKWNGTNWVDSTDATGGAATGNADSVSGYDIADAHAAGVDTLRIDNLDTDDFYFVIDANGQRISINNDIGAMTLSDKNGSTTLDALRAKLAWTDTATVLATQYDLAKMISDSALVTESTVSGTQVAAYYTQDSVLVLKLKGLSIVDGGANRDTLKNALWTDTAGVTAGYALKYDGDGTFSWGEATGGASDGQNADSIMGERVDTIGRKQAGKRTGLVWDQDSLKYKHYWQPVFDTSGSEGSSSKLYLDTDGKVKVGADLTGGANAGILDSVYGGPGATIVQNSDSAVTVNVNAKTGGGVVITTDSLEVDSSKFATKYFTTSNINDSLEANLLVSPTTVSQKLAFWPHQDTIDYIEIARNLTIVSGGANRDTLKGIDTTSLSSRINAKPDSLADLLGVNTSGVQAGNILKFNGTQWVDSADEGTGTGDGQNADSIMGKGVDTVGRMQAGKSTSLVYDQDSGKYKHYWSPTVDTSGTKGSGSKLYLDTDLKIKVTADLTGGANAGILDSVYGGAGLSQSYNSDSAVTVIANAKTGGGVIITNDSLEVDSTKYATAFDISDLMAHGDTASLSSRIDTKLAKSDFDDSVNSYRTTIELGSSDAMAGVNATEDTLFRVTIGSGLSFTNRTLSATGGGGGGGILDSVKGGNGLSHSYTNDSIMTVIANVKTGGGVIITNDSLEVDSSRYATQSDISDFMVHADTGSLSSRIDGKLGLNATADSALASYWATNLRGYTISDFMVHGDTSSLSARVDLKAPTASPTITGKATMDTVIADSINSAKLVVGSLSGTVRATAGLLSATASDTVGLGTSLAGKQAIDGDLTAISGMSATGTVRRTGADTWTATASDTVGLASALAGKSSTSHNHNLDDLTNVLTTGKSAGNVIKWNGTYWVDSTDNSGGEGSADGQDADSIMGKRIDTVGRMQAGLSTALVYDQDSGKYKHYYQPEIDTAGRAVGEKTAIVWVNDSAKYKSEKLFSVDTTNGSVSSSKRWVYYQNDTIKISSSDGMFTAAFDDSLNNAHNITATEWAFENDVRINDTLQMGVDGGAKGVVNFSDGSANWGYLKVQDLTADRTIFLPNVNTTDTLATLAQVRARADSSTALYWADTTLAGGIATQADIAVKLTATEAQARLSADTTLIFAAHVGLGMATDTALFRPTYYYPARYNTGTDTLVFTEIRAVGQGSPNLTLKMAYHATIYSGSATEINTSALTVNGTTTGQTATIANAKVPPGVYIWFTLPAVTTQPTALNVTAHGYRIKKR